MDDFAPSVDSSLSSASTLAGSGEDSTLPLPTRPITVLHVSQWQGEPWIHGFSTRSGAASGDEQDSLNLGYTPADSPAKVLANRKRYLAELTGRYSSSPLPLVTLKQMHSAVVRKVTGADAGDIASLWGDGMVTNHPAILLGILTADCFPILLADRRQGAVGALHAGWRGTLKGIAGRGVEAMQQHFGSCPEDITAALGPGIRRCCFSVGEEVRRQFSSRFPYVDELFVDGDNLSLDLEQANQRQLIDAGIPQDQVFSVNECTSCRKDLFFSYRAESGRTGRMMAVIGLPAGNSR